MIGQIPDRKYLISLLSTKKEENELYQSAFAVRNHVVGNHVYLRGLIEISNICKKDCLYCGIRHSNSQAERYLLQEREIVETAIMAYQQQFGSIVLQGGERDDKEYVLFIDRILKEIKRKTNNNLGITLSLGEQEEDTYKRWFESGAHRYLLRIETSNEALYKKIHPDNSQHSFRKRLNCIFLLKRLGYQAGSGVMIGLPFQTIEDLADDLLFLKSIDVDMVGMGPYLEHQDTPLYSFKDQLLPVNERLRISLHMIASLRILMPDINIAATTALQTIDPLGREKGVTAGANVIMPNITPHRDCQKYNLYQNKPFSEENSEENLRKLAENIQSCGCRVAFGKWGDPLHGLKKSDSQTKYPASF